MGYDGIWWQKHSLWSLGKVLQELLGKQQIQKPYSYGQKVGKKEMSSFQTSLPEGTWSKIKKERVTMKAPKKAKKKDCGGV